MMLLVLGARDYIKKNRFPGAIIGSSGGIDSALTAAIAADAIGSENVRTYMMPYKYTADISIHDAEELASNLGITHNVIEIGDIFDLFALRVIVNDKKLIKPKKTFSLVAGVYC